MKKQDLAHRVATRLREGEGPTELFGLELEAVGEGYARVSTTVKPIMLNGVGTAHGGVIFTLADAAFAYACNSRNDANVALQASIVFLRPAKVGERLTAEAREVCTAWRSGVYAVEVKDSSGDMVATFDGLCRTLGRPILEIEDAA